MRRLVQLGASLTLALSGVMLVGSFTAADATATHKTKPGVLQAAWFWETAYEQANSPVAAGPAPANEPSGVPDGDLAVAHTAADGSSSKMTALAFDIGALTPGTIVDDFTVSVTLDSNPQAANAGPAPLPIVACLPTRLWPAELGGDYTNEPAVDCSTKVKPKVSGSVYTFQITSIAQQWVDDQNIGVALVNDPDNTQTPFQAVFTGAKTVKASMTYTPAAPTPTTTTPPVAAGGTTTTGGTTGGSSSSVGMAPPPAVGNVPAGGAVSTAGNQGQPPQVANPVAAPQSTPVAKITTASSAPTRAFWTGAAGLALLLLLLSLVLGDEPAAATSGGSRLDRVLRNTSGEGPSFAAQS